MWIKCKLVPDNLDSLTHSISKALHDICPANKLHLHRTWVRSLTSMILQPVSSVAGDQRLEVLKHNPCGTSFRPSLIVFANGCFVYWTHQYCTLFYSLIGFTPEVVCSLETSWLLLPAHCWWVSLRHQRAAELSAGVTKSPQVSGKLGSRIRLSLRSRTLLLILFFLSGINYEHHRCFQNVID